MISTLYPTFQHWSDGGSVFIMSDPHFEDADMNWRLDKIKELTGRTDINSDFIPIYIVRQINKTCHRNDTIICLGDVGNESWIKGINCRHKVLIKGNHDKGDSHYDGIFDEIYSGPLFIAKNILLSHEPLKSDIGCYVNIHGHCHGVESEWIDPMAGIKREDYFVNTCCEKIDFTPVNLGTLIKSGLISNINDIHRFTIDKASLRKEKNS